MDYDPAHIPQILDKVMRRAQVVNGEICLDVVVVGKDLPHIECALDVVPNAEDSKRAFGRSWQMIMDYTSGQVYPGMPQHTYQMLMPSFYDLLWWFWCILLRILRRRRFDRILQIALAMLREIIRALNGNYTVHRIELGKCGRWQVCIGVAHTHLKV